MRPNHGEAEFEGRRLQSLRNLPLSFFPEVDDFFSEADDVQCPEPAVINLEAAHSFSTVALPQPERPDWPSLELGNKTLPIHEHLKTIVETVENTAVTIIAAETGTGKSTQVPQALFASGRYDTIYLTQPRRAAAYAIRDRIRKELDGAFPGAGERLTCYQTAISREGPDDAPIRVVTDGLQLAREIHNSNPGQKKVIIIDELHERNMNVDLLAALAKHEISKNPDTRVVVMSATMDTQRVANYFADVCPQAPAIIEVPGRNFHVQRLERPDSTVAQETLTAAKQLYASREPQNTILAFQPGKAEIKDTIDEVRRLLPSEIRKVATILPFHSKLPKEGQDRVFREYPGVVIIVATNSAQTSLTLPRIKYVIDSGLERRIELDHEGTQGLVLNQISQADCDQRAGRAGRVSNGIYIATRGSDRAEYMPYAARMKYPLPEILRTDIVRNTLRCAAAGFDIADIGLLDNPSIESIERAKTTLRAYGTIDENNVVTPLGLRIDQYPLRVSSARMMVEAARYSEQTRAYVAAIVAAREVGGLQLFGRDIARRWKGPSGLTEELTSDHLAQLDIFIAAQGMSERELQNYDLDTHNVQRAYEQFRKIARLANAPQGYLLPPTLAERLDITNCVVAGLTHSIYKHVGDGQYEHVGNSDTQQRTISNRSVVAGKPAAVVGDPYRVEYFAAGERVVRHTIEYPTVVHLADLGRIAAHLTEWKHDGIAMRAGTFVEVQRQYLGDMDLGMTREVVAEPSMRLREVVIAHAMEHAGPQQQQLRGIKRRLEQLARIAKDHVPQLTQDKLEELVARAAPADITDPTDLDYNLRRIVQDENISLASYVSPEREQYILDNAPDAIIADDVVLRLTYRGGKPIATHIRQDDVALLKHDVFLKDGREVKFRYGRKVVRLHELQEALAMNANIQAVS